MIHIDIKTKKTVKYLIYAGILGVFVSCSPSESEQDYIGLVSSIERFSEIALKSKDDCKLMASRFEDFIKENQENIKSRSIRISQEQKADKAFDDKMLKKYKGRIDTAMQQLFETTKACKDQVDVSKNTLQFFQLMNATGTEGTSLLK